MSIFASTFAAGFQDVVKELLMTTLPGVQVLHLWDGLVVYQGNFSPQRVRELRFTNNSFIVLKEFNPLPGGLHQMLNEISHDKRLSDVIGKNVHFNKSQTTFRIVVSDRNQTVSIKPGLRQKVEEQIAASTGMRVNRAKPKTEFWFLNRSEGVGFFLFRLTSHTAYEEVLEQGQLKPEICHMLCFLSEPDENDIFLDPFCGYGSIPLERAIAFPYNMIFASDQDPEKKAFVRNQLKKIKTKGLFIVKTLDALALDSFEDNFIDKIVTDPPWGLYENDTMESIQPFYNQMLEELVRIVKPGGLLVILTARKIEFEAAQQSFNGQTTLVNQYDVLISGKKAGIYKLQITA